MILPPRFAVSVLMSDIAILTITIASGRENRSSNSMNASSQQQISLGKSNMSTGQALSDVARQRQLETHALKCFHHQYNPQNKTQQAQEVQKKGTEGEDAPIAESNKPPLHAEYRSKDGSQDVQARKTTMDCAAWNLTYGRLSKRRKITPVIQPKT